MLNIMPGFSLYMGKSMHTIVKITLFACGWNGFRENSVVFVRLYSVNGRGKIQNQNSIMQFSGTLCFK